MTTITDIITYLQNHLDETDITLNPGASADYIYEIERSYDIWLPDDIKQFYMFSDGFFSEEDQFQIVPLYELKHRNTFYIAEYMTYCDMWELSLDFNDRNKYKIISHDGYRDWVLTNSFAEFINRFFIGGVFENGGLYDWNNELTIEWIAGKGYPVIARFRIENTFMITNRGFVIAGKLIEGKINAGNIICAMDSGNQMAINIVGVDYGHSPKGDFIGLRLGGYISEAVEQEFKKLIGSAINIYSLPNPPQ